VSNLITLRALCLPHTYWIWSNSRWRPSRHLGFGKTRNSAIRSTDLENPTVEQNMKWIGRPLAEIWPFEIFPNVRSVVGRSVGPQYIGLLLLTLISYILLFVMLGTQRARSKKENNLKCHFRLVLCDTHDTTILIVDTSRRYRRYLRDDTTAVYRRSKKYREMGNGASIAIPCSSHHSTISARSKPAMPKQVNKVTVKE